MKRLVESGLLLAEKEAHEDLTQAKLRFNRQMEEHHMGGETGRPVIGTTILFHSLSALSYAEESDDAFVAPLLSSKSSSDDDDDGPMGDLGDSDVPEARHLPKKARVKVKIMTREEIKWRLNKGFGASK